MNYVCEKLLSDPYKFLDRQNTIESCERWFQKTEKLYDEFLKSKRVEKKRKFFGIF
jgi:hypothetical protein